MLPVVDEDQQEATVESFQMQKQDSQQKKFTLYLQRILALLIKLEETGPLFFKDVTAAIEELLCEDWGSSTVGKDLK